ncbi:class I SAM-dependent methyltransferase [Candidatus Micrarchaeota archaeon]|nr:class I SAM-dependent methyltransferase [Candidatus Micrarchaeota archaeon]
MIKNYSKFYDVNYALEHEKGREWEYNEVIKLLNVKEEDKILDLGCNTGDFCNILSSNFKAEVKGIDLNQSAICRAREKYPELDFQLMNLNDLNEKEVYNKIVMIQVIEHLNDPLLLIKKARDALVPGGQLLLTTPNTWAFIIKAIYFIEKKPVPVDATHLFEFNPFSLKNLLKQSGFKFISIHTNPFGTIRLSKLLGQKRNAFWFGNTLFALLRK